jgi:acyl dehydratase
MHTIASVDDLTPLIGQHLGYSAGYPITQERVDLFAEATGDHQWIHVDPERAASGP